MTYLIICAAAAPRRWYPNKQTKNQVYDTCTSTHHVEVLVLFSPLLPPCEGAPVGRLFCISVKLIRQRTKLQILFVVCCLFGRWVVGSVQLNSLHFKMPVRKDTEINLFRLSVKLIRHRAKLQILFVVCSVVGSVQLTSLQTTRAKR